MVNNTKSIIKNRFVRFMQTKLAYFCFIVIFLFGGYYWGYRDGRLDLILLAKLASGVSLFVLVLDLIAHYFHNKEQKKLFEKRINDANEELNSF